MKKPRSTRTHQHNDGVALILTLLFVVLLTVLVVEFAYEAQVEASYSMNSENEFQAKLAARSAVYKGISILETDRLQSELAQDGQTSPVDSRLSSWALPGEFEPLNDAVMRATITDEYGKLNLNALVYRYTDPPIVREHLQHALVYFFTQRASEAGIDVDVEALVASIIDWLDEDDESDGSGAESDFYEAAENPYPCKNGPMDSIDELLLIRGMTPELFFGPEGLDPPQLPLTEYLTVHGDWYGRINPNTVLIDYETDISEVLEAFSEGCREARLVDEIFYDNIRDFMLNAQDDFGAFQSIEELNNPDYIDHLDNLDELVQNQPSSSSSVSPSQSAQDIARAEEEIVRQLFTVHSHVFRIYGDALLDDILVRNEAYVLRVPQDVNLWGHPLGTIEFHEQHPLAVDYGDIGEYYRILEWKVIQ